MGVVLPRLNHKQSSSRNSYPLYPSMKGKSIYRFSYYSFLLCFGGYFWMRCVKTVYWGCVYCSATPGQMRSEMHTPVNLSLYFLFYSLLLMFSSHLTLNLTCNKVLELNTRLYGSPTRVFKLILILLSSNFWLFPYLNLYSLLVMFPSHLITLLICN